MLRKALSWWRVSKRKSASHPLRSRSKRWVGNWETKIFNKILGSPKLKLKKDLDFESSQLHRDHLLLVICVLAEQGCEEQLPVNLPGVQEKGLLIVFCSVQCSYWYGGGENDVNFSFVIHYQLNNCKYGPCLFLLLTTLCWIFVKLCSHFIGGQKYEI